MAVMVIRLRANGLRATGLRVMQSRTRNGVSCRAACAALALLGLAACFPTGPDFLGAQQLHGVRVLGVVSEPASGVPGAELGLSLELFDAAPLVAELRRAAAASAGVPPEQEPGAEVGVPATVAWIGGCHNPPGDAHAGCYPLLQQLASNLPDPLPDSPSAIPAELSSYLGLGRTFSLPIPQDILAGRQLDTGAPPFGVSFTFFAVCRGVLRPEPAAEGVPLRCDDRDSGERLGAGAFVRGFVTTYTYAGALNSAPELLGVTLNGLEPAQRACEADADCQDLTLGELSFGCGRPLSTPTAQEVAAREAGAGGETGDGPQRCLPRVPPCVGVPCAQHELLLQLGERSVEPDVAAAAAGRGIPDEILWVKYFGVGGFDRTEVLINDRGSGFNSDFGLGWAPPAFALETPIPVWAVVQDNRGGTSIARWDILVRH